jgi:hypothetical protein
MVMERFYVQLCFQASSMLEWSEDSGVLTEVYIRLDEALDTFVAMQSRLETGVYLSLRVEGNSVLSPSA